jgi:hypothetical protein
MDAEGCFGVAHALPRKGGLAWYRIRVSASQHGDIGVPADVLFRLQAAFGGLGRIEKHGDPDDYRWLAEGSAAIQHVLAVTGPWLGAVKLAQADLALHRFAAQTRLKGSVTHCVRGHLYGGMTMRGGRMKKFCRPCDRINSRRRRAAVGIPPRQFKDISRRYTF